MPAIITIFIILIVLCTLGNLHLTIPFLIIAFILGYLIKERNKEIASRIEEGERGALHITNLDVGGVFKLSGVGDNLEEYTLKVMAKHLYKEGDFYWYEFECDKGDGEKIWVEVEDDDETIVSIVLEKLKLHDINTTSEELATIDDEETGLINYKGANYKYCDSSSAIFYRHCKQERAEKFYYWDFVRNNKSISVEKWGDSFYEVYLSQNMRADQITIFSNKTNQ